MLFSLRLLALTSSSLFHRILIFGTARTNGYNEIRITKKYIELDQLFGPLSLLVHPRCFLFSSVLLIFVVFCVVLLCVFTFWVPWCGVRYDVHTKTTFGSSLPEVVCRRVHVYYLCLFAYRGVQHILCCVLFFRQFLIASSAFSHVYLQLIALPY